MFFLWALLPLAVIGDAAAHNAYLLPLDIYSESVLQRPSPIDSETANAIIARRLDATNSLSLDRIGEEALEKLDLYGGQPQSLLGFSPVDEPSGRLIFEIEGRYGMYEVCLWLVTN